MDLGASALSQLQPRVNNVIQYAHGFKKPLDEDSTLTHDLCVALEIVFECALKVSLVAETYGWTFFLIAFHF